MKKELNKKDSIETRSLIIGMLGGILSFNLAYIFVVIGIAFNWFPYYFVKDVGLNLMLMPVIWIPLLFGYMYISKHYDLKKKYSDE